MEQTGEKMNLIDLITTSHAAGVEVNLVEHITTSHGVLPTETEEKLRAELRDSRDLCRVKAKECTSLRKKITAMEKKLVSSQNERADIVKMISELRERCSIAEMKKTRLFS